MCSKAAQYWNIWKESSEQHNFVTCYEWSVIGNYWNRHCLKLERFSTSFSILYWTLSSMYNLTSLFFISLVYHVQRKLWFKTLLRYLSNLLSFVLPFALRLYVISSENAKCDRILINSSLPNSIRKIVQVCQCRRFF